MVQTTNRFFDEVARLMNDAVGVGHGVRREFETLFRNQSERILRELNVVQREEFEAFKDMARRCPALAHLCCKSSAGSSQRASSISFSAMITLRF
jgi:BMFP domain-containing protein YqiC